LDPLVILGTLTSHLLEQIDLPKVILELMEKYYKDGDRTPELSEVLNLLSTTIGLSENVILVLDGVDEASEEDRQNVFGALRELIVSLVVPVKIFISCRDKDSTSLSPVPARNFSVPLSQAAIKDDIEVFVRHSVATLIERSELVIREPELEDEIAETLIAGAQGM
jgi:hypothetical protein